MDTVSVRQTIASAKRHEQQSGELARQLLLVSNNLHPSIDLPADNAVAVLLNFTNRYIDNVPELIEAVQAIADGSGLSNYTDPVINLAVDFFVTPPQSLDGLEGMKATMAQAYLAHRLVEELNDRFLLKCNLTLIPMDMTRSNLLIHYLIGEPLANNLDHAVKTELDTLEMNEDLFSSASLLSFRDARSHGQNMDYSRWHCLADSLAINLSWGQHLTQLH